METLAFTSLMIFRPITTYSGRGTSKKGIDQEKHAVIYIGAKASEKLPGETALTIAPVKVIAVKAEETLDPLSRVNLGKGYRIEFDAKVREIGDVERASLAQLMASLRTIREGGGFIYRRRPEYVMGV